MADNILPWKMDWSGASQLNPQQQTISRPPIAPTGQVSSPMFQGMEPTFKLGPIELKQPSRPDEIKKYEYDVSQGYRGTKQQWEQNEQEKKLATKSQIENENNAYLSGIKAAEYLPYIDRAIEAYDAATKAGAVGPIAGSLIPRKEGQLVGYGADKEKLRQAYEKARSFITLGENPFQGQGTVTNFERLLSQSRFPDLTALSPDQEILLLKQLRQKAINEVNAGKKTRFAAGEGGDRLTVRSVFPEMQNKDVSDFSHLWGGASQ